MPMDGLGEWLYSGACHREEAPGCREPARLCMGDKTRWGSHAKRGSHPGNRLLPGVMETAY